MGLFYLLEVFIVIYSILFVFISSYLLFYPFTYPCFYTDEWWNTKHFLSRHDQVPAEQVLCVFCCNAKCSHSVCQTNLPTGINKLTSSWAETDQQTNQCISFMLSTERTCEKTFI
uniref:Uncharacterized protein n=1 Tax=Sphaeramia orbicularis TaxID=375764 RepID=A0A673CJC2_9TELE